jgi:DNA end-binding protein Ku
VLAHTIFYQDEVRADNQFEARASDVVPGELLLARTFVDAIAGPFAPEEFKDAHRQKLQDLITAKLKRGEVAPAGPSAKSAAPMVDIMDALKKSIDARKKRTPMESSVARREPGRATALRASRGSIGREFQADNLLPIFNINGRTCRRLAVSAVSEWLTIEPKPKVKR